MKDKKLLKPRMDKRSIADIKAKAEDASRQRKEMIKAMASKKPEPKP